MTTDFHHLSLTRLELFSQLFGMAFDCLGYASRVSDS